MTPDEQRVALGEWYFNIKGGQVEYPDLEGKGQDFTMPNYPADLNAVHELVIRLDSNQWDTYYLQLVKITSASGKIYNQVKRSMSAAADQHCEALCRTLFPERF